MNNDNNVYLDRLLNSCPAAGDGVHRWLFTTALRLHRSGHYDHAEIVALLAQHSEGCGRSVPPNELIAAVRDSSLVVMDSDDPSALERTVSPRRPKWPPMDPLKRDDAIARSSIQGVASLVLASPVVCPNHAGDPDYYLDHLFPNGSLICVGWSKEDFTTLSREAFRGNLAMRQLIVPSAMSALTGPRQSDAGQSAHTLANTGPRMYLVTEFDSGTNDQQASLVGHLKDLGAPLVMVLSSAGKSLHAWWDCRGVAEERALGFMTHAVTLGADSAMWTRCQFARMPEGWRPACGRQSVLYFNPSILGREVSQ